MREKLRPEVLTLETAEGGLDLYDLLYDRVTTLDPEEAAALDRGDEAILDRLSALVLLESDHAQTLRRQRYARHKADVHAHRAPLIEETDWSLAEGWPDFIASHWRQGEALRRLAEARAAGNQFIALPGFMKLRSARELAQAAASIAFERMDTPWVKASRHGLGEGTLYTRWVQFLTREDTRALFGAILGRRLEAQIKGNVWRLETGDMMPVHTDGKHYQGTISLGLNEAWRASQGGAIARGAPEEGRFRVDTRWLPHLGDVLLFAPTYDSWHAVEPVLQGERLSITAWWTKA